MFFKREIFQALIFQLLSCEYNCDDQSCFHRLRCNGRKGWGVITERFSRRKERQLGVIEKGLHITLTY